MYAEELNNAVEKSEALVGHVQALMQGWMEYGKS